MWEWRVGELSFVRLAACLSHIYFEVIVFYGAYLAKKIWTRDLAVLKSLYVRQAGGCKFLNKYIILQNFYAREKTKCQNKTIYAVTNIDIGCYLKQRLMHKNRIGDRELTQIEHVAYQAIQMGTQYLDCLNFLTYALIWTKLVLRYPFFPQKFESVWSEPKISRRGYKFMHLRFFLNVKMSTLCTIRLYTFVKSTNHA